LAGSPVYLWQSTHSNRELPNPHLIGVLLSASGRVKAQVVSPIDQKRVTDVRAIANPDGTWGVLFGDQSPRPMGTPRDPDTYWFSTFDGKRWRSLEKLPKPSGRIKSNFATKLVRRGNALYVAAPVDYPGFNDAVALFIREDGKWRMEEKRLGIVAYLALDTTSSGTLLLGVVAADTTESDDNSLFLYELRSSGKEWVSKGKLVRGAESPVHDPEFAWSGHSLIAGWLSPSAKGGTEANVLGISNRWAAPVRISSPRPQELFVLDPGYPDSAAIVVTATAGNDGLVKVGRVSEGSYRELSSFANPFDGIRAVSIAGSVSLIGPVHSFNGRAPVVLSVRVRFDVVCKKEEQ